MKYKVWVRVLLVIFVVLCAAVLLLELVIKNRSGVPNGGAVQSTTWEEYLNLSLEEQDAFFQQFDSEEAFEAWMAEVKPTESTVPVMDWDKSAKQPNEYTWEEYQTLSPENQEAFYQWFDSADAFETWMEAVKPVEGVAPVLTWDKPGKKPSEYTWPEYLSLSIEDQEAFFQWFGSVSAFEAWVKTAKPEDAKEPDGIWDKPGKNPDAYTWAEYQALTPEEQDAFYLWFGSKGAFEAWMNVVKPEETAEPLMQWDKPGKEPSQYTWKEYQKLTSEEQDAFYRWFSSLEAFETWMEAAKPSETTEPALKWDKDKNPDQYTWEEYQMLSPEEMDAFFQWFGSVEAFETWMKAATGTSA